MRPIHAVGTPFSGGKTSQNLSNHSLGRYCYWIRNGVVHHVPLKTSLVQTAFFRYCQAKVVMTTRNLNCFIATASRSSRCRSELLFRLFVATFCHTPKNIVYKLFVRVCLKMTMKSRHYVVIFRADRTNFFHSHLSSTFYINNKAEDSLPKRSFCIIDDHRL